MNSVGDTKITTDFDSTKTAQIKDPSLVIYDIHIYDLAHSNQETNEETPPIVIIIHYYY